MGKAKQRIRDSELNYKKGLGQNFIYDESLLEELAAASGTDETEPVDVPAGFEEQRFLNRIVVVETELQPMDLSRLMHRIEDDLGRVRGAVRNIPRTIDIDMIDYEGVTMDDPELTLPHPRAKEREFVMEPLRRMGISL